MTICRGEVLQPTESLVTTELKKNNSCVIKVWNKNSKNNSLLLLNENILKKWGMDIIYIAHIPD
jgi:hypothetical protein